MTKKAANSKDDGKKAAEKILDVDKDSKPEEESQAAENQTSQKIYPRGVFGFLARLRDTRVLKRIPSSWGKILLAFLSHRNPQGFCWPSQRAIAKESGVSLSSVERFVKWTKASLGWRVTRKRYNIYYIPLDEEVDTWMPTFREPAKKVEKPSPQDTKVLEAKIAGLDVKKGETVTGDGFEGEKPSINDGLKPSPGDTKEDPGSKSSKRKDYGTSRSTTPPTPSPKRKQKRKTKKRKMPVGEKEWEKAYRDMYVLQHGEEAAKKLEREAASRSSGPGGKAQ